MAASAFVVAEASFAVTVVVHLWSYQTGARVATKSGITRMREFIFTFIFIFGTSFSATVPFFVSFSSLFLLFSVIVTVLSSGDC